ncbi:hypothetical protein BaRGS_00036397, partial [Batillaria attramentaria]
MSHWFPLTQCHSVPATNVTPASPADYCDNVLTRASTTYHYWSRTVTTERVCNPLFLSLGRSGSNGSDIPRTGFSCCEVTGSPAKLFT